MREEGGLTVAISDIAKYVTLAIALGVIATNYGSLTEKVDYQQKQIDDIAETAKKLTLIERDLAAIEAQLEFIKRSVTRLELKLDNEEKDK